VRRVAALVAGLALAATQGAAQAGTADTLAQARRLYDQLEIEQAVPILRRVLSSAWPLEVTPAQRVEAFTYLGAALALLGQADSATLYFRRAIEQDPFAALDPQRFTPAQLGLFAQAGRRTLVVGARPVRAARVDPRTERITVAVTTSHAARLRVELRPPGRTAAAVVLFSGESEGPRDVAWDGLVGGGLAPAGRYEVAVIAVSRVLPRSDSTRVYFDLRHDVAALEDTLPALGSADLLPESRAPSAPLLDLAKGLAVGAGVLVAGSLASDDLGGTEESLVAVAAGAAAVTGVVAFVHARRHRTMPANVTANAARRAQRAAANEAILRRNAERIARTVLLVEPAAGGTRSP
jgi:tetratricopeptide (TPR) repeat protein